MEEEYFDEAFLKRLKQLISDDKNELKHPYYKAAIEHCEEMSWHVYGTKPERLLERVRPREDDAIKQYRLDSYEPITKSVCKKALSITHKIFNSKLYSIRFDENEKSQLLKKYTLEDYPRFNSVVNYLANFSLKKNIADPNGVFLVQPNDYMIKESQRVEPIVTCYGSRDIWDIGKGENEYFLFFDEGGDKEWYFTYVDKISIHKLRITKEHEGARIDQQRVVVEILATYNHNFGEIPVWYLGGEYSDKNYGLYESFFSPAVPFWNEAINDHSDVTGAYRMHIWPQKWEVADECDYVAENKYPCQGGYIYYTETNERLKCPSCKGAGRKTIKSPYESYLVNRDKFTNTDGTATVDVPFGYVAVPVDATKMLEDKANRNLEMGLNALAMDVVNKIGENQSGVSKEIDRTELHDFLQKLADQFFDVHLTNIYYYFTKYMFGVTDPNNIESIQPEISKPTQFNVYSFTELTGQFAAAKEAGLSASYLSVKQAEIQGKEFQTHPQLLTVLDMELTLDPLSGASRDDVALMLQNGTVTKETVIIHDNIKIFVRRALEETKNFENLTLTEKMAILEGYAAEVLEKTKVQIDMSAFAPQDQQPVNQ